MTGPLEDGGGHTAGAGAKSLYGRAFIREDGFDEEVFGSHRIVILGVGRGAPDHFQDLVGSAVGEEPQDGDRFVNALAAHGVHHKANLAGRPAYMLGYCSYFHSNLHFGFRISDFGLRSHKSAIRNLQSEITS